MRSCMRPPLAISKILLTQCGYVAPHCNEVTARPSVRVERSSMQVPTYVRVSWPYVRYCTTGSAYSTSERLEFLKDCIRNALKMAEKQQFSSIFSHFCAKKCDFCAKNANFLTFLSLSFRKVLFSSKKV